MHNLWEKFLFVVCVGGIHERFSKALDIKAEHRDRKISETAAQFGLKMAVQDKSQDQEKCLRVEVVTHSKFEQPLTVTVQLTSGARRQR